VVVLDLADEEPIQSSLRQRGSGLHQTYADKEIAVFVTTRR
jgi:hypothetical protein